MQQFPTCPTHGIRYNPAIQDGCMLCEKAREFNQHNAPPYGENVPPKMSSPHSSMPRMSSARVGPPERQISFSMWYVLLIPIVLLVGGLFAYGMLRESRITIPNVDIPENLNISSLTVGQAFHQVHSQRGKGDVQVIHLWATWCPSCVREMPQLKSVIKATSSKNIKFYMFAIRSRAGAVKRYGRNTGFVPYRITRQGPGLRIQQHIRKLGGRPSRGIPYTLILDGKGRFVNQWAGGRYKRFYMSVLKPHLKSSSDTTEEL